MKSLTIHSICLFAATLSGCASIEKKSTSFDAQVNNSTRAPSSIQSASSPQKQQTEIASPSAPELTWVVQATDTLQLTEAEDLAPRPHQSASSAAAADAYAADKQSATKETNFVLAVAESRDLHLDEMQIDVFNSGPTYTLAEIEQIALTNNSAIAAATANSSKASGLWNQVGTRPNPTLGYFGQQLADRNTDQHGVFIEQEFVRGDKLRLNQAVLSHTTNAQRWETETQRERVLTDIRVRFYEAIATQQQLEATRQFEQMARQGVQVAMDRQKAEEGSLIEVLQSKILLSEIALAAERSEAAYIGAWKDLAAIAGLPDSSPARLVSELKTPDMTPDWDKAFDEIIALSPELSVAQALVCEKSAMLKRQQVQMIPNITGQLGAGYDRGTDSGMINVQVSAPIPVWNKNQGNISAAHAEYVRAVQNVTRIQQSIKSRLARTAQEFEASMAAVKKYEQEIIPQATQSLELSESAYRAGELDFLQVLIVRRNYYESMMRLIDAKGQLAQATAKVDGLVLTGGLDAPQDFTSGDGIRGASFGGQ